MYIDITHPDFGEKERAYLERLGGMFSIMSATLEGNADDEQLCLAFTHGDERAASDLLRELEVVQCMTSPDSDQPAKGTLSDGSPCVRFSLNAYSNIVHHEEKPMGYEDAPEDDSAQKFAHYIATGERDVKSPADLAALTVFRQLKPFEVLDYESENHGGMEFVRFDLRTEHVTKAEHIQQAISCTIGKHFEGNLADPLQAFTIMPRGLYKDRDDHLIHLLLPLKAVELLANHLPSLNDALNMDVRMPADVDPPTALGNRTRYQQKALHMLGAQKDSFVQFLNALTDEQLVPREVNFEDSVIRGSAGDISLTYTRPKSQDPAAFAKAMRDGINRYIRDHIHDAHGFAGFRCAPSRVGQPPSKASVHLHVELLQRLMQDYKKAPDAFLAALSQPTPTPNGMVR